MAVVAASPEEQRALLGLQEIDVAIRGLEHRRAHLPEQQALDETTELLAKVSTEARKAREESESLAREVGKLEADIGHWETRRKHEEGRMYSGTLSSEKEVEAVRAEIASARQHKHDLEDQLLDKMERSEELDKLLTTLDKREAELTEQMSVQTTARDEAAEDLNRELDERRAAQGAARSQIDDELLEVYEATAARKDGVAVAVLQSRTCMGCRLELTAIEYEEVMDAMQRGMARCEQCGRLLVKA